MEKYLENFKEFNILYQEYLNLKSEDNVNALNRNLAIISTILDTKCFDPLVNPEVCLFYINLHNLIGTIDAQSTLLWTSIAALKQALNSPFQKSLVDNFKYLSVLTKLLEEVTGKAKTIKLLNVLQKLSLNVTLTWNEPFLEKLMKALVKCVLGNEEEITCLATSTLINLCFNNVPAIESLRQQVDCFKIIGRIKKHKILKFKLQYILYEVSDDMSFELNVNAFMKHVFNEITDTLTNWNTNLLCHTVDFFVDLKQHFPAYFKELDLCDDDISNLFIRIEDQLRREQKIGDGKSLTDEQLKYMQKFMEFLKHSLEFVSTQSTSVLIKVLNFALKWTTEDFVAERSYEIIQKIILLTDIFHDKELIGLLVDKLPEILIITNKLDFHVESTCALFKFVLDLLMKEIFKDIVFSSVHECFFQQYLEKLTNYSPKEIRLMSETEISMNIYGLKVLQILAKTFPHEWFHVFEPVLQNENTLKILGRGLFLPDAKLIEATLQILRECPVEATASAIASMETTGHTLNGYEFQIKNHQSRVFVTEKVNHHLQERIEKSIDKILEGQNKIALSFPEMIDLFEFKISMTNNNELHLLKRLDDAGLEITKLCHDNILLESRLISLKDKIEEIKAMHKREKQSGLKNMEETQMRLDEIIELKQLIQELDHKNQTLTTEIKEKDDQITKLINDCKINDNALLEKNQELSALQSMNTAQEEEVRRLNILTKNTSDLIEKIKDELNVKTQEIEIVKEEINKYEKENSRLKKLIDELKTALNEKNSVITEYETEVKEIETMKTRLIEIVQKKKGHDEPKDDDSQSSESSGWN